MKKLIATVAILLGCGATAYAQWSPLPSNPVTAQIEAAQRKVIELRISQAKALPSTATLAQKTAAGCEVQKAVKAMIPGVFTCGIACGC